MKPAFTIRIRDPIHGTLLLSRDEVALVDHPAYQRLRTIKQLGLADLAFPGATHTRYSHGLGTMHIASRMFTSLANAVGLADGPERRRLLQTVRLATLFHDVGHAPLSHSTEVFMPSAGALALGPWLEGSPERQASHEDYTLKIITGSDLTALIAERFASVGVTPDDIATLIAGRAKDASDAQRFVVEGADWMPLLRQCVSSELDADRMDYLLRDSYFAGVPYGRYDLEWLIENLRAVEVHGAMYLGLDARASFAFEDYLLSRYHMFMSVYFHHIPIGYEVMLKRFHEEANGELTVPADVPGYLDFDDVTLIGMLRKAKSHWARRIVERRAYRMLVELKELHAGAKSVAPHAASVDVETLVHALADEKIDALVHSVKGQLSKYFATGSSRPPHGGHAPPLFMVEEGAAIPVEEYSPLYHRYSGSIHLRRVYVEPTEIDRARKLVASMRGPRP
ncbi:HD domain-containing protein [Myxococcota bacterium]|nr:HD domain-containing protein [Myxococcota bacterium]